MRQTIILDFDGVVHSYTSGWQGPAIVSDPPTDGAVWGISKLRETHRVVICSSRCHQHGGKEAIIAWLAHYGIEVDEVTNDKPPHVMVVDDRAFRFEGDWGAVIEAVPTASIPWNKKGLAPQP